VAARPAESLLNTQKAVSGALYALASADLQILKNVTGVMMTQAASG